MVMSFMCMWSMKLMSWKNCLLLVFYHGLVLLMNLWV
ncbi:hypothetical protein RDI58_001872 [Solanum bulbocastanum]|uniref:Uncharacterized protein n=1 Tax=Solanum bulbocastanum TaxID=147425 RepID=A0AAN8YNI3_SOLBU